MGIVKEGSQPFEPYARLMNILGDQLITDKKVAVIELIKNCYDADAEKVWVRFFNMHNVGKENIDADEEALIEIEDDGDGMTLDIVKNSWLRPATPNKLDKKTKNQEITGLGRTIQGEKGVGRFAIHRLGSKINLYTKSLRKNEISVLLDFSEYNPEQADLFNQPPVKYYKLLSEVNNQWFENSPPEKIENPKGTIIQIRNLREKWSEKDVEELIKGIQKLLPPRDMNAEQFGVKVTSNFDIELLVDNTIKFKSSESENSFSDVTKTAHFSLIGTISSDGVLSAEYTCTAPKRKKQIKVNLFDEKKLAKMGYDLKVFKIRFKDLKDLVNYKPKSGEFSFSLYAYNLNKIGDMSPAHKQYIKDNFVYVLRDGVRVYPFGEKGFDWLNLDKYRAVYRAGDFLSYNDLLGFVYIGQRKNPFLKDTTNREGLMNISGAYDDFTSLLTATTEVFGAEIRIEREKAKIEKVKSFVESNDMILKSFDSLKKELVRINDVKALQTANKFITTIQNHTSVMKERMETVEDLAGLGMAVEKASHDALMLLSRMRSNIKDFRLRVKKKQYTELELLSLLEELEENLMFIYEEMQVIQPLFKFQRKAVQDISVYDSIQKVIKYFRREIEGKIDFKIIKDNDIIVKTNSGLILQILINLIDNAIYWVNKAESRPLEIICKINSKRNTLTIADNGPGIREDIVPLVFNEFFSQKADGRGLGLYIVKEILLRVGGEISVVEKEKDKLLAGANFTIKFNNEE